MVKRSPDGVGSEAKNTRRVVVVCENTAARDCALRRSHRLAGPVEHAAVLEVEWWTFASLADNGVADDAAGKAAHADLVVFALASTGDLPQEIKMWIETWVCRRCEREGAIVGLVDEPGSPIDMACLKEIYLRHTALRAGMDYLSHVPETFPKVMPESVESYTERAGQVTSVLDTIIHTYLPPPPTRL